MDGALAKVLDARAQVNGLDKEALDIVTKGLSPEKKARAALFLGRFEQRMGAGGGGPGPGDGPGEHRGDGPGMGRDRRNGDGR